jgi:hypothetical protein
VDEIQVLTQRASDLGRDVDFWNLIMLWGLAFAAVAAVVIGISTRLIVLRTGQQAEVLAALATAKEARLSSELKEKDRQIAGLNVKAKETEVGIVAAQTDASNAQQKATEAKAAQQQVQIELAKQQAKAAESERSLLELRERIKPRRFTDQQAKDFVATLKTLPNGVIRFGWTMAGGDESFSFLSQLVPLFKEAGWTVQNEGKGIDEHLEIQVIGIGILIKAAEVQPPATQAVIPLTPTLVAIRDAFAGVDMEVQFLAWPNANNDVPEIVVGSKPIPKVCAPQ